MSSKRRRPASTASSRPNSTANPLSTHSTGLTHMLLRQFYIEIRSLEELVSEEADLVREGDSDRFRKLVRATVVGSTVKDGLPVLRSTESEDPNVDMGEIIAQVHQRIFAVHSKVYQQARRTGQPAFATPKHVLALGYRLSNNQKGDSHQSMTIGTGPAFHNVFPNTIVSSLTSSREWDTLLSRVGPDTLINLLSNPTIALFSPLQNACYLQIAGVPLAELKPIEAELQATASCKSTNGRKTHSRTKRKRRRRGKGAAEDRGDEDVEMKNASAPSPARPSAPPPPETVTFVPRSPQKRLPTHGHSVSVPLLGSSAFPAPQQTGTRTQPFLATQVSPMKRCRLGLRATQSVTGAMEGGEAGRAVKRRKVETLNSANNIVFARYRMYHARASKGLDGKPAYGLSAKRNFSCSLPAYYTPARHLAKYVFPRQFGLHNVFTSPKPRSSLEVLPDYQDREIEIKSDVGPTAHKVGSIKTPGRLKPALPLLKRLALLHGRCNYRKLLDQKCPSKITHKKLNVNEKSVILDIVSEPHTQLSRENLSVDISHASQILPHGGTQAHEKVQAKPKLAGYACLSYEVERYVQAVVQEVIPRDFWGSAANFKLVQKNIATFLRLRRYETLSIHAILQGFALLDCDWLRPDSSSRQKNFSQRPNALDFEKRRELLAEFLFWFFDGFVTELVRTAFYVTDSATHQNRPLFFRQDDWATLCAPLLESLGTAVFEKVPDDQLLALERQHRELGFSYVRLLPKEAGVRPIVNLARRPLVVGASLVFLSSPPSRTRLMCLSGQYNGQMEVGQPINKILRGVFDKRKPHLVGALVSNPQEIYAQLKAFKTKLVAANGGQELPKLYFVKVDVRACYDTIKQAKLLGIVDDVLSEASSSSAHTLHRARLTGPTRNTDRLLDPEVMQYAGKSARQFKRKACSDDDLGMFRDLAENLAEDLHNVVISDQVVYDDVHRTKLMSLLREHITTNLVKVSGRLYRQKDGIPQGSVLSSLLCSLFYGDMERTCLGFTRDGSSLLLRYVDDFLFISTKRDLATRFLQVMHAGIPEYGCYIASEKRLTNFDVALVDGEVVPPLPRGDAFPWCGLSIDTKTLELKLNTKLQMDKEIADQLTVQRYRKPGQAFINAIAVKIRSHAMYTDTSYNSLSTVYSNIYQAMLVVALKFQVYVQEWSWDLRHRLGFFWRELRLSLLQSVRANPRYCHSIGAIQQIVRFKYTALTHQASSRKARKLQVALGIKRSWVAWLGYHAFHRVLSRRPSSSAPLLDLLANEVRSSAMRHSLPHLRKIVEAEGTVFAEKTNALRKVRRMSVDV
ncbi:SPOSA6832_03072 [Sporobolomyces salmonicolor]|uniref:Telomerase reverse transcriptase n=1 Tax=Sporidiobolus salmonicolor TaxID=5005 RepID=A0A0D6EMS6_SPOSA|nr:SPOSA6832_03072 [Sporobolomyces salmonicolor]